MRDHTVEELVSRRDFLGLTSLLTLKALVPGRSITAVSAGEEREFRITIVPKGGTFSDRRRLADLLDELTKGLVTERCRLRAECRLLPSGGAHLRVFEIESRQALGGDLSVNIITDPDGAHRLYAEALRLAVRLAPDEPYLVRALADYYLGFHRFDEGIACFEALMEEHPMCALLPFQLGILCDRSHRKLPAQAAFQKAHTLDPDDPITLYNLGVVWADLGQPKVAERYFREALARDPNLKPARARLDQLRKRVVTRKSNREHGGPLRTPS